MASKIVVVGSANMDLVFSAGHIPSPGETVPGSTFLTFPGGKGANQAVAIARLGGEVSFVGRVGSDAYGVELLRVIEEAGVDVSLVVEADGATTGVAAIFLLAGGENAICAVPGANAGLTADHVREALATHGGPILTQLEIPIDAVEAALRTGPGIKILNPAPAIGIAREHIEGLHFITPNESETESLTNLRPINDESCSEAAGRLLDLGAINVIITLGANGSYWESRDGGGHFPTIQVRSVDTTAAGDAFNGALAWFLGQGREIPNAIQLANIVGALSTAKRGAMHSMPTLEELKEVASHLL